MCLRITSSSSVVSIFNFEKAEVKVFAVNINKKTHINSQKTVFSNYSNFLITKIAITVHKKYQGGIEISKKRHGSMLFLVHKGGNLT